MPVQTLQKIEIAKMQLLTALKLYLDGSDFLSALTLAGAAEEILGKLVQQTVNELTPQQQRKTLWLENAMEQRQRTLLPLMRHFRPNVADDILKKQIATSLNLDRNALKHLNAGLPDDGSLTYTLNPKQACEAMLERTIENVLILEYDADIPGMQEFYRQIDMTTHASSISEQECT